MKGQVTLKDKLLADAKTDMGQLAKIVQDMTQLNNELNIKVTTLNNDMERLNSEVFQHKIRAEHSDELEKSVAEQVGENHSLQR
jgi:hypothetical protein